MAHDDAPTGCHRISIPESACYLRFTDGRCVHSEHIAGQSARGEMLVLDYDEHGNIVGIQLVGDGKPCQEPPPRPGPVLKLVPK